MRQYVAPLVAAAFLLLFGGIALRASVKDSELFRAMGYGVLNIVVGLGGYYFGTSQSSARKDETIARALQAPAKNAPPHG